jgi:poly(3-hydroxybutyrate) depolymerase
VLLAFSGSRGRAREAYTRGMSGRCDTKIVECLSRSEPHILRFAGALVLAFALDACSSDSPAGAGAGGGAMAAGTGGSGANASGGVRNDAGGPSTSAGGNAPGQGGAVKVGSGGIVSTVAGGTTSAGGSTAGAPAGGAAGSGQGTGGATGAAGAAGGQGGSGGASCTKQVMPSMDCAAPLAPGDQRSCKVGTRQYYVYAPKNFDVCTPAALVVDAHGATQTAESQFLGTPPFCTGGSTCWKGPGSGWRLEADMPGGGFILVTPSSGNSGNTWDAMTDPPVMMQMIEAVKKIADVDPKKIYFTGISNGAALSYWTACANPGVFAGISPNAGGLLNGTQCNGLSKPLNDIQFDDEPDFAFMDSQSAVTNMAMLDHCKDGPKDWKTIDSNTTDPLCRVDPDDNATKLVPCNNVSPAIKPTTCQIWEQCDSGVRVVFCKVAPSTMHGSSNAALDGHIIYENASNLNTPSLAWRFFKGL